MEGAPVVAAWQCAYRPVAFGPGGSVVGSEEFDFFAFVIWWRVADVVVDGKGVCGVGGVQYQGNGCCRRI